MDKALTIPPKEKPFAPDAPAYLDFDLLRAEGLKHIQDLSGRIWTDHNVHDPGITILEVLCYALTDLGYRTRLPDADLFASDPKNKPSAGSADDHFITAAEILGSNPMTELDWRKLLADLDGVKNAWVIPIETETDGDGKNPKNDLWTSEAHVILDAKTGHLAYANKDQKADSKTYHLGIRGVYKILVELESNLEDADKVLNSVKETVRGYRNLCEDFAGVQAVRDMPLRLCGEVEIDAQALPDDVALAIFERVQEFFSPTLRFYTLKEALDRGMSAEEIFEGRPPAEKIPDVSTPLVASHGFIDSKELEKMALKTEIYASDLYHLLLGDDPKIRPGGLPKLEGIAAIRSLKLFDAAAAAAGAPDWKMDIPAGFRPTLDAAASVAGLVFYKRGVPYAANADRVLARFERRLLNPSKARQMQKSESDLPIPAGEFRADLNEYYSIQNDFPNAYGIGDNGLPASASPLRAAQAKQLKGYLLLFDHLLANYLAQLSNIRQMFSNKLASVDKLPPIASAASSWLGLKQPELFVGRAPVGGLESSVPDVAPLFGFSPPETPAVSYNRAAAPTTNSDYVKDDVVARSIERYHTPYERDHALRRLVAAFNADQIDLIPSPVTHKGGTTKYRFVYTSKISRPVELWSYKLFDTDAAALRAGRLVQFVATLENSYNRIDDAAAPRYSFELIFRPPAYEAHLRSILEDESRYFERKNRFFDHLLRQFAEDFTDYTLLMFALNKGGGDRLDGATLRRRFALDKARFLENYAKASRDRSKGADYSKPAESWASDNVSGMDGRVSKLIGAEPRKSKTLNYFDIIKPPARYFLTVQDNGGRKLLRSITRFSAAGAKTVGEAKKAAEAWAKIWFEQQLQKAKDYRLVECPAEDVYGFQILDADGTPLAESFDTFGSRALAKRKMNYSSSVLTSSRIDSLVLPNKGFGLDFTSEAKGVFFQLTGADRSETLRAKQAAPDAPSALRQMLRWLRGGAANPDNWRPTEDPEGRGFSFEVVENGVAVAENLGFFKTPGLRDERMRHFSAFVRSKKQYWTARRHPSRLRWSLSGHSGEPLLYSLHYFKEKRQTASAFRQAAAAIVDKQFGGLEADAQAADGLYGFSLWRIEYNDDAEPVRFKIGVSAQKYASPNARDAAMRQTARAARDLEWTLENRFEDRSLDADDFWEDLAVPAGAAHCVAEPPKYSLAWQPGGRNDDEDGEAEGLFGEPLFDSEDAALESVWEISEPDADGTSALKDIATDPARFHLFSENDGFIHSFFIRAGDENAPALATYEPFLLSKAEAERRRDEIAAEAARRALPASLSQVRRSFRFVVRRENEDEQIEALLRGTQSFDDQAAAENHFNKVFLDAAADPNSYSISENAPYIVRVEMADDGKTPEKERLLAVSAAEYGDKETAKKDIIAFLKPPEGFQLWETESEEIEETGNNAAELNPDRWRLSDPETPAARYLPARFSAVPTDDELVVFGDIQAKYAFRPPLFSEIYKNPDAVMQDEQGNYFFCLRDFDREYWRSKRTPSNFDKAEQTAYLHSRIKADFGSADEAAKAFDLQYFPIISSARDMSRYRPARRTRRDKTGKPDGTYFVVELLDEAGDILAESFHTAKNAEGLFYVMAGLRRHAQLYPFARNEQGYGFRIFDLDRQAAEWESSSQAFKTPADAEQAFADFLELLPHYANYRLTDDSATGKKYAELVEILLEEKSCQKIWQLEPPHDLQEENNRQTVENFTGDLAAGGAAAFAPTIDYLNGGMHGFRIVNNCYAAARHPASFHTKGDREKARDLLWRDAAREKQAPEVSSELYQIIDARRKGLFGKDVGHFKRPAYDDDGKIIYGADGSPAMEKVFYCALSLKYSYADGQPAKPPVYDEKFEAAEPDPGTDKDPNETALSAACLQLATDFAKRLTADTEEALQAAANLNAWLVLSESDGTLRLAVTRADGSMITVFEEWAGQNADAMAGEIGALYEKINLASDVVRLPDGMFGFEIRRRAGTKEKRVVQGLTDERGDMKIIEVPVFEVVWRHIQPYKKTSDAAAAAVCARRLMKTKANYTRAEAYDKSPTLLLADPKSVVASHPRTYGSREECLEAWQRVRSFIDTEGMHVVERLLLRPRSAEDKLLPVDICDEDLQAFQFQTSKPGDFAGYVMGADPYSFIATIVLPHWPTRFRNLDFRVFFENTLRREAPAHVGLDIIWLDPMKMGEFEAAWRSWLEVAADPDHYEYSGRKNKLIDLLPRLRSVTADAVLAGCGDGENNGDNFIILDKTTLR